MAPDSAGEILDCTLRDGSYVIDFQFTAQATADISRALDASGVRWIEVGHGLGLNASNAGKGAAREADGVYIQAATSAVSHAKIGVFCIPGIARVEDVDAAADAGIAFIRIGTEVDKVLAAAPFIDRAKARGLYVCTNLMKSYAADPEEWAKRAHESAAAGADVVYLVDSAGGMTPRDLEHYFFDTHERGPVALGFHGHNNLGLAVANAIRAVELGAAFVDTSLQGMGRSAGNAPTEMVAGWKRMRNPETTLDLLALLDAGERLVRPMLTAGGFDPLSVVTGVAQFHSGFLPLIQKYASQYNIDPRCLILKVAEHSKVDATESLVKAVAREIAPQ